MRVAGHGLGCGPVIPQTIRDFYGNRQPGRTLGGEVPNDRGLAEANGARHIRGSQPVGFDIAGQSQHLGHGLRFSFVRALTTDTFHLSLSDII